MLTGPFRPDLLKYLKYLKYFFQARSGYIVYGNDEATHTYC